MRVIKIQRRIRKRNNISGSEAQRSIRRLGQDFFVKENKIEFALEALLFGLLVAISAWPIIAVAGAINKMS
jgi:hypothetical protein